MGLGVALLVEHLPGIAKARVQFPEPQETRHHVTQENLGDGAQRSEVQGQPQGFKAILTYVKSCLLKGGKDTKKMKRKKYNFEVNNPEFDTMERIVTFKLKT